MRAVAAKAKFTLREPTADILSAMESGRQLVDVLLAHGAETNAAPDRIAPLINAIDIGYKPFVEALLTHGADPNHVDEECGTPLQALSERSGRMNDFQKARDAELAQLLRAHGATDD
jgi:ankyrin repeat protein